MSDVFSQLNAGTSVTAGLRHVKKGDVTAPAAPVAAAKAAASARPAPAAAAASKPARTALEGKKWMVEYHKNDPSVTVQGSLKETVYVYKCEGSTIAVRGKVNAITLDGCKKTAILVESAMAGVELVNCSGCKVQVTGTVATISVDKCDGTQLILSRDATSADIISAKSSELNIIVPGASEDDEYKEHAIAEQFISKYVDGKFVTTAVEHTA
jgi:adenylyl cyclase-associated protein